MRAVIFDLDGTLADHSHRLHHIKGEKKNWDAYTDNCHDDKLIEPIRKLLNIFADADYEIMIVSGRMDTVKEKTEVWLEKHEILYEELYMRKAGDYRPDYVIKEEILDDLIAQAYDIRFTVDDRPQVVAMWRRRGLTCLQCADWNE